MKRLRYTKAELDACVAGQRELLAAWMIENGFATGHGDTMDGLLRELRWQISERVAAEREACAKFVEDTYLHDDEREEALRARFVVPEAASGFLEAWHQPRDVADAIRNRDRL